MKHIKKELKQIRDTCNRLLDKLDEREPREEETVVDSSTSAKGTSHNVNTPVQYAAILWL